MARVCVEIEAELRGFDRDFAVDRRSDDPVDELDVVVGDRLGLVERREVLAEPRVHRPDAGSLERPGGAERVFHGLARHEATDGPAHEPQPRQARLQPLVARQPEEHGAHQGSALTMPPSTGTIAPVT